MPINILQCKGQLSTQERIIQPQIAARLEKSALNLFLVVTIVHETTSGGGSCLQWRQFLRVAGSRGLSSVSPEDGKLTALLLREEGYEQLFATPIRQSWFLKYDSEG